ncbi:acetylornithine transaminase [Niveibacterium umoris]|uniref:Acetylornithine aminotransferase n=1 Tax=Niveibacterium umoris TaxID=1193620 RepID=A0A840BJV8_9RHOO|nr:acetylornithine transaminase [Niveibacterium umoris]MBB4012913.1 acetylornithine/N-succinyldiaminopimelate aminotransferase [Niveibacterium umoris]
MNAPAPSHALMNIAARPDAVMVRGEGSWLEDAAGRRYLDFVQGWAVNGLGHAHPAITRALATQAATLVNPGPAYFNAPALEFAARLAQLSGLDRVFPCNTGAEANEGAIKLARKWGQLHRKGAFEIITFHDGFHGRTLATMSASGKPGWDTLFAPQVAGFPKATLNDLASVEALIGPDTVAVMLEPIQGEAGVRPATLEFLRALRALCDREGLLLILDEVQTGIGRTGTLFRYEAAGIRPDILTLAKGIGGGVPLAALLATEAASCFVPGDQGGTYCGNPLMAAVGNAVLEIVAQPDFLASVRQRGAKLAEGLRALAARHRLGEVRGAGLLLALELGPDRDAPTLVACAREAGLLLNAPRPHCLRLMPALTVCDAEIDQMLTMLDALLAD